MVLAAPLFLVSQTKSMRGFYLANKQAFINLSMGFTGTYLGLSLLSKMVRRGDRKHESIRYRTLYVNPSHASSTAE